MVDSIEKHGLPPVKFQKSENHTKVSLFPHKKLTEMTKEEKILACYQHACLMYEENKAINNKSMRERFSIDIRNSAIASRIIADTLNAGYIKLSSPDNDSKKYAKYIPFYG